MSKKQAPKKKLKKDRKNKLHLFSPAKVNLFFRILSKRKDGFHEIETLMQAVNFGDYLSFELSEKDQLETNHPQLSCGSENLIWKGVDLFRKTTGFLPPLNISLMKNIPLEAGFGGGSSNLATTLWALNQLSGKMLSIEKLKKLAGKLSSDAPFFFSSGSAFCKGRGEIVHSLSPLTKKKLYLAIPKFLRLSTPLVYRHCSVYLKRKKSLDDLIFPESFFNDLEESAFSICRELKKIKEALLLIGFEKVLLSGSGSGFFCIGNLKKPFLNDMKFIATTYLSKDEKDWYEPI